MTRIPVSSFLVLALAASALAQRENPFGPQTAPKAEPIHDYDLLDLDVKLDVDYPNRVFSGVATNTLAPTAANVREVRLMASPNLTISVVTVDGQTATFRRAGRDLFVAIPQTAVGAPRKVAVTYRSQGAKGGGFGSEGGFHWVERRGEAARTGFWTQGETEYNSNWAPTWDYPNDFATTRSTTTVPAAWNVVGNGVKTSERVTGDRKTTTWRMEQPHATYLLAVYAFPMETVTAKWRGKPLTYNVPAGLGNTIEASFSDTPDMLEFYSNRFGVEYAWPKYAQTAAYDFGGGMENISATILGAGSLTDRREGPRNMASLNSHELGHQWFGDLVTCRTWEHAWLNESWATYAQFAYFRHARGEQAYLQELAGATAAYLAEARRYKRPIQTDRYPNADAMFDSHLYPKGGMVLHTLRVLVGDDKFWAGTKRYLSANRNKPVVTANFEAAMSAESGRDLKPFFDQWIRKPGHPVLEWSSSPSANDAETVITVRQTQTTDDGTPVYEIPNARIGVVRNGVLERIAMPLTGVETTITVPGRPDAVIIDPDHEFLREIPQNPWRRESLLSIVKAAPDGTDKASAMRRLLAEAPTVAEIEALAAVLTADGAEFPAVENVRGLAGKVPATFWLGQSESRSFARRSVAFSELAKAGPDPEIERAMRAVDALRADYPAVTAAARYLAAHARTTSRKELIALAGVQSRTGSVENVTFPALIAGDRSAAAAVLVAASASRSVPRVVAALSAMTELPEGDARVTRALRTALSRRDSSRVLVQAAKTAATRKERGLKDDLRIALKTADAAARGEIEKAIAAL